MDGLVDQDSPAVELPGTAPAARVVVRLRPPPPYLRRPRGQAAKLLCGDRAVDGQGCHVEAVLADDSYLPAGRPLYPEEPIRRLERDIDGLFDDNVFACFQRGDGVPGVHAAGSTDAHGVQLG